MTTVNTTRGVMPTDLLEKREGEIDNENELTKWVEFWYKGELVHRSAFVRLKKNVLAEGVAAMIE